MLWLLQYAIFGLVVGALARLLHPGRDPMNLFWTMLLGVGGAVLGGWVGSLLGFETGGGLMGWIFAIGASVLLLVLYHFATAQRSRLQSPAAPGQVHTSDDYKRAVFDDLSRGPRS